jgi:membrane protein YdbS with pleckstrin-like domain
MLSEEETIMHCMNCGSYAPSSARFCPDCGAEAGDPEATRLAPRSRQPLQQSQTDETGDVERVIFTARPTMLFIKIGYGLTVLGAILLTIFLALIPVAISLYISIPLALSLLLIPAYYHIKRNMVLYTLTDSKIEIDHGLIARTTRNIPLHKVQDVTVSMSILQRLLGFGNVVIENASEVGGVTVLRNINDPRRHADILLRELRRFAR